MDVTLASFPRPCRALLVGATGGIGSALTAGLAASGIDVHAFGRHRPADAIGVTPGQMDVTDEASVTAAFASLGDGAPLRLVIVASGLLHDAAQQPEKALRMLDPAQLARSFAVNAIGPALVAKHALPLMPREGRIILAAISARVGSITDNRLGGWYGYRASKAALNQLVRTLAIEVKRSRPEALIVALHPGTVETALSAPFRGTVEAERLFTPEIAAAHLLSVLDGLSPEESGGFFAWDGAPIPF